MNPATRMKLLKYALIVFGIIFIVGMPIMGWIWPAGWVWHGACFGFDLMALLDLRDVNEPQ